MEKIALQEIERVRKDGVSEGELKAAIAKTLADAAFKRDGSFAVAGNLNECIAAGDWSLFYTLDDAIAKVTTADIKRVANIYLNRDQSTTGWFEPTPSGGASTSRDASGKASRANGPNYYRSPDLEAPAQSAASAATDGGVIGGDGGSRIAPKVKRMKVAGIDLVAYPTGVKDVVTLRASLPAGKALTGSGNPAIPALTGMMLEQGTRKQDKFAIAEKLEAVGANISFTVGTDFIEVSAKSLKRDAPLVIGLVAEQLRMPAFSAEEFAKVKKQFAGSLKRRLENTDFRAADAFSRVVYPLAHPNRNPTPEDLLAAVETARLEDVIAFHQAAYGPAHMTLVMVGDLDLSAIQAHVDKAFAGWQGGSMPVRVVSSTADAAPQGQDVVMADKTSVSVVLGQASGLRYRDPDYQALRVATAILGSGFTGRLMANVRDKEGLTYDVGARLANDMVNAGDWKINASFAPALLEKGIASTRRQLALWYDSGATAAEIEARKSNLIGAFKVDLATTDGMAGALLAAVNRGYDVNWLDDFPIKIMALTDEQVNRAMKKYLKPDSMILIKAGTLPAAAAK